MKRIPSRGFTLIELLVVVAVIGLLALLILVATQATRAKAQDSRVHTDIGQMRRIAEDYFNSNNTSYTNLSTCTTTPTAANCAGSQSIASSVATLKDDLTKTNGNANPFTTSSSAVSFCVYSNIVTTTTKAFCADSSGRTSTFTASAGCNVAGSGSTAVYSCP